MSLKKDKQKVLGETFDDARIKTFLDTQAPRGVDADYHCLEVAYRGMHQENFATFIAFFTEAGRNINALSPTGKSFAKTVAEHHQSAEYLAVLTQAGAH